MSEFGPKDFTPEQTAAYVNGTRVVALAELLAMHWRNEQAKLDYESTMRGPSVPGRAVPRFIIPFGAEQIAGWPAGIVLITWTCFRFLIEPEKIKVGIDRFALP